MKRIIINIVLAIVALAGLVWVSVQSGLIALLGFFPMYVGSLGLIKLNTDWIERY